MGANPLPAAAVALISLGATAAWLGVFRWSYISIRVKSRIGLAVTTWTGIPVSYSFESFCAALYLVLAAGASLVVLSLQGRSPLDPVSEAMPWSWVPMTALGIVGAMTLTSFVMTVVSATPLLDGTRIAAAMREVRWISGVMAFPPHWRWTMPMASATVEEFFFRGVVLTGLLAAGAGFVPAVALSSLLFLAEQLVLTQDATQGVVIGVACLVISAVGASLVILFHNVVPAILVHASFAGYYTSRAMGGRA